MTSSILGIPNSILAHVTLFDKQIERLASGLRDALLIVTADHGLTDVKMFAVDDFPDIEECLSARPTREPRNLSLFVREECKAVFPERWNAHFGDDFRLMTGDEAFSRRVFGEGAPHPRARAFLGDYVALATGASAVWFRDEDGALNDIKAAHAGLRPAETQVPLIMIDR
jgi:hypothetical protein